MRPRRFHAAGLALALLPAHESARAAGGAHVIDDAEVETPGVCHVELWATRFRAAHGLATIAPACTPEALPSVEIGATIQHGWQDGARQTLIGPALKFALRPVDKGPGIGLAVSAAIDARTGKAESAAAVLPVTFRLGSATRAHLNFGYHWARGDDHHAFFAGAQIEQSIGERWSAMAEGFVRDSGRPGFQAGLRWTPHPRIDVDLLGGHRLDDAAKSAVTLGLTIRS